ncbi:MAG: prepilin peptidase [Puniceicoccaceae bacterium]
MAARESVAGDDWMESPFLAAGPEEGLGSSEGAPGAYKRRMELIASLEWLRVTFPWIYGAFAFVFGASIGSFLNVCIYRIPAGISIIHPGSRCPHCGTPIRWYDNLPIIGWLRLKGKARCCGAPISVRYPAVEALTGALIATVLLQHPFPLSLIWVTFVAILVVVTFIDLDHLIIPDRFSIGGTFLFLFLSLIAPQIHGIGPYAMDASFEAGVRALVGVAVGTATVCWISMIGEAILNKPAMGQGDYKLMGLIGAALGWEGALFSIFGGAFIGTVILLPVLLLQRKEDAATETSGPSGGATEEPGNDEEGVNGEEEDDYGPEPLGFGAKVPFGPMLAGGALLYLLFLKEWVDQYFEDAAEALKFFL